MKTLKIEQFEDHTVILENGIDYTDKDLVADRIAYKSLVIKSERLQEIAREHGFDRYAWRGFEETHPTELEPFKLGVKVTLRKDISGR